MASALLVACGNGRGASDLGLGGAEGEPPMAEGGKATSISGDPESAGKAGSNKPSRGGADGDSADGDSDAADGDSDADGDVGNSAGGAPDDAPPRAGGGGTPDSRGGCEIEAVFGRPENGCSNTNCHGKQFQGGVDLATPGIADRLVGVRSSTQACGGQLLIDPEHPEDSLLLRLVDAQRFSATPGQCGVMMPYGSSAGLTGNDLSCVESWVRQVAAAQVDTRPPTVPFESVGVESYVQKVKTLLTGGAVTDDDLTRVKANPAALADLVEGWQAAPAFRTKMMDFFRISLQQKLIGTLNFQLNTVEGPHRAQLAANAEESFLRTAWDIVQNRQPFTSILTTRHFAVTTGLLVALAYEDNTDKGLRANKHVLYRDPPEGTPAAPWSLSYQVQNKTWLLPQLAVGCPKVNLTGLDVYDMLMGLVRCPAPVNNVTLSTGTVLSDADFADWHFVDIALPGSAEVGATFYDVDALRAASDVYLYQPRIGFFTTPAFLGNWDTNDGNKFRVTTNQTLITALGEAISPADPTKPLSLEGLDALHAPTESSCYGCHQFLDPMRGFFSSQFSIDYQATNTPTTFLPSLSFHGVTMTGGGLTGFAYALANHPLFATAWVQKLCYYANSQSCDASDPEFLRVAKAFADSKFDFLTLVKELFTSPLVTGASWTQSYANQEPMVSITRRQHFCQLIDERLGTKDTCKNAGSVVGLIPQDEFSRGAPVPVQPAVSGLFHFAAAEKLCSAIASKLVTNTGRFPPAAPYSAIFEMVHSLMGLPPSHSRSAAVYRQLSQHYENARLLSATTTEALRDTFTVACMSPDVMGLGL
ncbi:MAG: hypothetical protein ABW061_27280 [Polyangiaceae bacterium]